MLVMEDSHTQAPSGFEESDPILGATPRSGVSLSQDTSQIP